MAEHTPTPWHAIKVPPSNCLNLFGANGEFIAQGYFDGSDIDANMEFLALAINAHAPLLEALELVNQLLKGEYRGENTLTAVTFGPGHVATIRAAIGVVRGMQS